MNTIAGQLDIFDALADLAADEKERREQVDGISVLFASTARGIEAREAEFDAWTQQWGPVITTRTAPGLRSVPGRSPWGGYDVAHCVAETHHRRLTAHTGIRESGKAHP